MDIMFERVAGLDVTLIWPKAVGGEKAHVCIPIGRAKLKLRSGLATHLRHTMAS
jgi:hypothetical protein